MGADYGLPTIVIVLKLFFRLFTDQEVERIDLIRAAIGFPVDIAFLSFSFGAVELQSVRYQSVPPHEVMLFALGCILCAAIVTFCSKRSDKAFTLDKNGKVLVFGAVGYLTSFLVLFLSLNIGSIVQ